MITSTLTAIQCDGYCMVVNADGKSVATTDDMEHAELLVKAGEMRELLVETRDVLDGAWQALGKPAGVIELQLNDIDAALDSLKVKP